MTLTSPAPLAQPQGTRGPSAGTDLRLVVLAIQFWVIGLIPFLSALTSGRYFVDDRATSAPALVPAIQGAVWAFQGRGVLVLAVVGFLAVLPLLRTDPRASGLALGFCGLWCAGVLAALLGAVASPMTVPVSMLLIGATWYFAPPVSLEWLVRQVRLLTLFYAVGSLVAALALSSWALEQDYVDSILPGVPFRLHGLATHANYLAPVLLFGLIVERLAPRPGLAPRLGTLAICAALVLTQSKTTFLALAAVLLIEGFRRSRNLSRRGRLQADVLAIAGVTLMGLVLWRVDPLSAPAGATSLDTIQARVEVWRVTLQLWWEHPVFGFGLNLWGTDMRLEYLRALGWTVPHAHNQLVQTLGEAGLVGALALGYYVLQLVRVGRAHARSTGGASLAIVVFVLVECVTECPLARAGGDMFLTFGVFVVLLTIARTTPLPSPAMERSR